MHEVGIPFCFIFDVEAFNECETEDRALCETLFLENIEASIEAFPEIAMERSVNLAEGFTVGGVNRDIELGDGFECLELVGVLRVADQK